MDNSRIKILIYALIFLTVLNLAAIGTILYNISKTQKIQQPATTQQTTYFNTKPVANQPIKFRKPPKLHRILSQLNLSEAQQQQFMNIHQNYIRKIRPIFRQIRQINDSIGLILQQNPPNFDKIKRLSHRKAQLIENLTLLQAHEFYELSQICTPQQRQILYQLYKHRYHHKFRPKNRKSSRE